MWWLGNDRRLGEPAREIIGNPANDIVISVASLWEIVVKIRIGKLQADFPAVMRVLEAEAFEFLAIQPAHLEQLTGLPMHHRDPFDHLLIAQAIAEDIPLMTDDQHAALYQLRLLRCSNGAPPA